MTIAMTTNAVSQVATQPNSATRVPYLNRCVENLTPEKIAGFKSDARKWKILSIVALVAIPAIGIVASTLIAIASFPFSMPIAILGGALGGHIGGNQFVNLQKRSHEVQQEFEKRTAIRTHYEGLNEKTPEQLQRILLNMGIIWNRIPGMQVQHPEQLSRLNPVLAYARHLEERTKHYQDLKDKHASKALRQNDTVLRAKEQERALSYEYSALTLKIKNGFASAVLRNPDFCGDWQDYGFLSKNTYLNQTFGNALSDSAANQMFIFNNPNSAAITYEEAKAMTVAQLGQKFTAAMAG